MLDKLYNYRGPLIILIAGGITLLVPRTNFMRNPIDIAYTITAGLYLLLILFSWN